MREFSSFKEFAAHIQRVARAIPRETERALNRIGRAVEEDAKNRIGTYQDAVTSPQGTVFEAWPTLKLTTVYEKQQQGYAPPDNPLLRTGDMRDSIEYRVNGTYTAESVTVGSTDPVMAYQEFGTEHIPPRPVIGAAMASLVDESLVDLKIGIDNAFRKTN